ncbi:MAG: LytTR family DNA-binding domain-containing protein [Erysipelotrichaceae bacterium]
MKIKIVIDENLLEDEIVIACKEYNDNVVLIKDMLQKQTQAPKSILVFNQDTQYFLDLNDIIFFQSEGKNNYVHTITNYYLVKEKLYELEKILPDNFIRVSKSGIVNINKIFAINKNFASYGDIEFKDSLKQLTISRSYYPLFKELFEERRKIYAKK